MKHIVVAGGSIAAATAVSTLRAHGWDGRITLVTDEETPPYSRVPLSKGVLSGALDRGSVTLPALPDDVDVHLDTRATALDVQTRTVTLSRGTDLRYDGLIIATGSRPRRLAPDGRQGELVVRTLADAAAINARLRTARSAIVVGAGFLGMEVASTLRATGLAVTVIDRDPPLRRLTGHWLADIVTAAPAETGVDFVLAPRGVTLTGDPVTGVATADGQTLTADVVISAVGDIPNIEWLHNSGLRLAEGVVVDPWCQAAPSVVAAGDVATRQIRPDLYRRTPHWTNAVLQGRLAALNLLGVREPYAPDHYFWTEQFGLNIKIAGELPLQGTPILLEGDPSSRSLLAQWHRAGRPVAAATVNLPLPIVRLKRLATVAVERS
ncbi:NAD(P)/FAD-dependent oxidoreductase [Actinomadura napierensis]|uniref:FAD-dependent oxidoreductase n=1 Tax=Actinomadura napierensis TaxID=267854 RepID=A0ABP5KHU8_9ACTN